MLVQQWREKEKEKEKGKEKGSWGEDKGALSNKDNEWELYGVSFKKQKKF